jgi:ferrous iron transport protein A
MDILQIENGRWVKVVDFRIGRGLEARLSQLGFLPGNKIRVIRSAPFKGPLLIEVEGREIVLGRSVARNILVEYL